MHIPLISNNEICSTQETFRFGCTNYIRSTRYAFIFINREFSLDLMKSHMDDKYGHCFNSVIDELIASCFPMCSIFQPYYECNFMF